MNVLKSVEKRNQGNFNANHPELREGEVWLTNCFAKDFEDFGRWGAVDFLGSRL